VCKNTTLTQEIFPLHFQKITGFVGGKHNHSLHAAILNLACTLSKKT
jgi:hypothetical protein